MKNYLNKFVELELQDKTVHRPLEILWFYENEQDYSNYETIIEKICNSGLKNLSVDFCKLGGGTVRKKICDLVLITEETLRFKEDKKSLSDYYIRYIMQISSNFEYCKSLYLYNNKDLLFKTHLDRENNEVQTNFDYRININQIDDLINAIQECNVY